MAEMAGGKGTIILGNAPSSGSTLLLSLLGAHPDVYQTRELNIFDKPDWVSGRTKDLRERWSSYAKRRYDRHFPCEHSLIFTGFSSIPDYSESSLDYASFVCDALGKAASEDGRSVAVEKTPNNIFSLPFLHTALPHAKFVIIVRHPASVFKSLRRRGFDPFTATARWYFPNLIARAMQDLPRVHTITYEELTQQPGSMLRSIGMVLDLEDLDAVLAQRNSRQTDLNHLPSWEKDLFGKIVADRPPEAVPEEAHGYFARIRANDYFFDYVNIPKNSISATELARSFGYNLGLGETPGARIKRPRLPIAQYSKYVASCLYNGRPVRPLWHSWNHS